MQSHIFALDEATLVSGATFLQVAALVAERQKAGKHPAPVVVIPAIAGMNHLLFEMIRHAFAGRSDAWRVARATFYDTHQQALALLPPDEKKNVLQQQIATIFQQLDQELLAFPQEANQQMYDASARIASCGERLSILLMAYALGLHGIEALPVQEPLLIAESPTSLAWEDCDTQALSTHFSQRKRDDVSIFGGKTRTFMQRMLFPLLERGVVPVVAASLGQTKDGAITMLAQAASTYSEAYSPALIADALCACTLEMLADTNGLLAGDPHIIPNPPTIPFLSYHEAIHLVTLNSGPFSPSILHLLAEQRIPLRIRALCGSETSGTLIGDAPEKPSQARFFVVRRGLTMATLRRSGAGVMAEGALGDIFRSLDAFARQSLMFLHATPSSLSFLGDASHMKHLPDLVAQWYGWKAELRSGLALCACIGSAFCQQPLTLSYALLTLAEARIPVITAAYTAEGIFLVVEDQQSVQALRSLYRDLLDPILFDHASPDQIPEPLLVG